jgi:hypothetical protein
VGAFCCAFTSPANAATKAIPREMPIAFLI